MRTSIHLITLITISILFACSSTQTTPHDTNQDSTQKSTQSHKQTHNKSGNKPDADPNPNGPLFDKYITQQTFYRSYDKVRCDCYLDETGHNYDSVEQCRKSDRARAEDINKDPQAQAGCIQSVLHETPDVPTDVLEYFKCSIEVYNEAKTCLKEAAPDGVCPGHSALVDHCVPGAADSTFPNCYEAMSGTSQDWYENFSWTLIMECPI